MLKFSTPFAYKKGHLEKWYQDIGSIPEETLVKCYDDLNYAVRGEDMRIGHLMSYEIKDIIKAEGGGLRLLGYNNPREWQLYSFIESIPRAYGWIFALYRTIALERINSAQCDRCHFSINVPVQDRSRKKFFRALIRACVVDYQKPENKPRLMLVTIDMFEQWSFAEPPIRAIGEFGITAFPDAMNDFNQEMKRRVSTEFLSDPQYLGLQPTELLVVRYLSQNQSTASIAAKMRTTKNNINFIKRKIIQKCNSKLGHLDDARQWVNYLGQTFEL